jgi:hypothetical protein
VPLRLDRDGGAPPVRLGRQAIEAGALEVLERGEGVVQELLAWNRGDLPVALLEGDTLVGCKQNRVVAHSVIVAAGTSLGVPVGCMEQGRWSRRSARFGVGDLKMSPAVRRRTVADVKAATLAGFAPRLDQSRLWEDVSRELVQYEVMSTTSDYHEILESRGQEARERARRRPRARRLHRPPRGVCRMSERTRCGSDVPHTRAREEDRIGPRSSLPRAERPRPRQTVDPREGAQ